LPHTLNILSSTKDFQLWLLRETLLMKRQLLRRTMARRSEWREKCSFINQNINYEFMFFSYSEMYEDIVIWMFGEPREGENMTENPFLAQSSPSSAKLGLRACNLMMICWK
jgi:hypothetical protein